MGKDYFNEELEIGNGIIWEVLKSNCCKNAQMYTTKHFWNINMEIINQETEDTKNKTNFRTKKDDNQNKSCGKEFQHPSNLNVFFSFFSRLGSNSWLGSSDSPE